MSALRVGVPGRGDVMQTLWDYSPESSGKIKFRCQREGEERHIEETQGPKQAFRNHDSDHSRTPHVPRSLTWLLYKLSLET